jgi:hypothetical protein
MTAATRGGAVFHESALESKKCLDVGPFFAVELKSRR